MSFFEKPPFLKKGRVITGQWEGKRYKIIKLVGSGGSGAVYLVMDEAGSLKALKVSPDLYGLNSEYRFQVYLRTCTELQRLNIIPAVFEIDDCIIGDKTYRFIVMEYCKGEVLGKFRGRLGLKDAALVGRKVAVFLDCLHRVGLVFGDLKPGNIIFNFKTEQTYVVDYGSVTVKEGKLRQYTPGYDRATWQAGARVADESYDMFSLGMLLAVLISGRISRSRYKHPEKMTEDIPARISDFSMREAVRKALNQTANTCSDIFSPLPGNEIEYVMAEDGINRVI